MLALTTRRSLASVAVLTALGGCAGEPSREAPLLPAPRVTIGVRHGAGSPLAGGRAEVAPVASPSEALQVTADFVALETLPENVLEPLSARSRLVTHPSGEGRILALPRLLAGARAGVASRADALLAGTGRTRRFAELRGALPRGVTATFEAVCDRGLGVGDEPVRERVALHVFRRPAGDLLDVAVDVDGELASLDVAPLALGETLTVIVGSPFAGDEAKAIAVVATVSPPPATDGPGASAHRTACALCEADLAHAAVLARAEAAPPLEGAPPRPDLSEAVRALTIPEKRRGALFLLAQTTGAPLAEELALAGGDPVVAAAGDAAARELSAPGTLARSTLPELGWILERAALAGLRDLVGRGDLVPLVEDVALRRGGACGRNLGTFFGLAESSGSLDELERRLRVENHDLLEDSSPAVRARAFEWLAARGLAPPGYDPLAPGDSRRAALDAEAAKGERP
jgi:hypothetical protein